MNTAKKKLTLLSIFAMLTYCLLLLSSIVDGWDDFKLGFNESKALRGQTYFVDLKAKASYLSFPDSILNLRTGNKLDIRYDKVQVRATVEPNSVKYADYYLIVLCVLAMVLFFIGIYIPIQFFRLMKSLILEVVFDENNVKYMYRIGVSLLVFYVVCFMMNYITCLMNLVMFDFADYIIQRETTDVIWLLLGFVVLLFAEIVSKGSKIKEEQDLTI
jgi:hypothetical protein